MQEILKITVNAFLLWTLFGAAWGGIEFMLDRWERMSPRTLGRRIFLYGPLAWFLGLVTWGILARQKMKASAR